jgi:hypothetical protein
MPYPVGFVDDVAEAEHESARRSFQEVERRDKLLLESGGDVVDHQYLRPKLAGRRKQKLAAQVVECPERPRQVARLVPIGPHLDDGRELDVVRSGREAETVCQRRAGDDELRGEPLARREVVREGECPPQVTQAIRVMAVEHDPPRSGTWLARGVVSPVVWVEHVVLPLSPSAYYFAERFIVLSFSLGVKAW